MNNFIQRVARFNYDVVGVDLLSVPTPLGNSETQWLSAAIREEADELSETTEAEDKDAEDILVDQVDACVDAIVFATGGLVRMGLTPYQIQECLRVVMDANFQKQAGVKPGRTGAKDAVKPENWVGPEARIKEVLFDGR